MAKTTSLAVCDVNIISIFTLILILSVKFLLNFKHTKITHICITHVDISVM